MFSQKEESHKKSRFPNYCHSKSFFLLLSLSPVSIHLSSRQPRSLQPFPASTTTNGGFLLFPGAGAAG